MWSVYFCLIIKEFLLLEIKIDIAVSHHIKLNNHQTNIRIVCNINKFILQLGIHLIKQIYNQVTKLPFTLSWFANDASVDVQTARELAHIALIKRHKS